MTSKYPRGNGAIEWGTPENIFNTLNKIWGFNLDPCALNSEIAKCDYFFSPDDNGLQKEWRSQDNSQSIVFLNPPYGRQLKDWMQKARDELMKDNCKVVVALIPASIGTQWFHEIVYPLINQIIMVRGRIPFIDNDGTKKATASNHDSIILELRYRNRKPYPIERIDAKTGEWI